MLIDNAAVIAVATGVFYMAVSGLMTSFPVALLASIAAVPLAGFLFTLLRFYRKPKRLSDAPENEILSPADGNVIYVKKCKSMSIPSQKKNQISAFLSEFRETGMLDKEYWHIGINMTPFDVHRNSAPIHGTIVLLEHFDGEFLSLKDKYALDRNERNSYLILNDCVQVGVIQIASRVVRRIESYVKKGEYVKRGDWLGMITFGSQVDVLIPAHLSVQIKVGQQVYASLTVIAKPGDYENSD